MAEDEDSDIEILPAQGTVAFRNYWRINEGFVRDPGLFLAQLIFGSELDKDQSFLDAMI